MKNNIQDVSDGLQPEYTFDYTSSKANRFAPKRPVPNERQKDSKPLKYGLDESQLEFVQSEATNIRLLAPAGCGKTRSLLFRCLHVSQQSKRTQRPKFLIVTFTVAARAELLARLSTDDELSPIRDQVSVTTLNAFGYTRIRNSVNSHKLISSKEDFHFTMLNQLRPVWIKYPSVKTALEGSRKNVLPRQLLGIMDDFKSLGFDHERHANLDKFVERISELRHQGLAPRVQQIVDDLTKAEIIKVKKTRAGVEVAHASDRELYSSFYSFWREATEQLIKSATFTLEDQKYFAYLDERAKLDEGKFLSGAAAFDHVLVDEFQDINPLDLALIKAIVERNRASLTIAGDDDQAIFEWRGATPEYILNPDKYLGRSFDTYILTRNYRSPKNIVDKSQNLIAHNQRRVHKHVDADKTNDALIQIIHTASLTECLRIVLELIQETVSNNVSPAQVAIIGRKRSQLIPYQIFLASNNVSFCAAEDLSVFLSRAFERLIGLVLVKFRATTPQLRTQVLEDMLVLCDLVKRYPMAKNDKDKVRQFLNQKAPKTVADAALYLASYSGPLKGSNPDGRISKEMSGAILNYLGAESVSSSLSVMATCFEGLQIDLGKAEDDVFYTDPPFIHLAEYAERYGMDYAQFIDDIQLAKDQLVYVPPFEDDGSNSTDDLWNRPVQLMTALRAKGKEFNTVILLDVNDGIWPNKNIKNIEQREAERRVFYVAFTRPKKRIVMLVSKTLGNKTAMPSPFIGELMDDTMLRSLKA